MPKTEAPLAAKETKWDSKASRRLNIEVTSVSVKVMDLGQAIQNDQWWNDQLLKLWLGEASRAKEALDDLIFQIHDHITAGQP